jgi:hypothetical protein
LLWLIFFLCFAPLSQVVKILLWLFFCTGIEEEVES